MKKCERLKIKIYLSILILIILPLTTLSQDSVYKFSPHWYINSNIGVSYSLGDIAKYTDFPKWPDFNHIRPGADLVIGRQLFPSFGISAGVYYGFLTGKSENGNHFESELFDYSLNTTVNFNKLLGFCTECRLSIHGKAGIGQAQYKTKLYDERGTTLYGYDQSLGELRGSGIDGRRVVMIFPLSLGLNYRLSDKVQLLVDYTVKLTNSDLIDGKIAGDNKDSYNLTSIGLRYNFRKRKKDVPEEEVLDLIEEKTIEQTELKDEIIPKQITEFSPIMLEKLSDAIVEKLKPVIQAEVNTKPKIEDKLKIEEKEVKAKQIDKDQVPEKSRTNLNIKHKVEYCVQIRASFKTPLNINDISDKYNLEQSKIDYKGLHNNWHLYTVGSFDTLKKANKERENLIEKYGIIDAFVIRFENGKRVVE